MVSPEVINAAQSAHKTFYPKGPFASVTIAQFGWESGWGKFPSGKNNYFGIKATKAQIAAGKATLRWTREEMPDGTMEHLPDYFADYDSLEAGFTAHAALLVKPWYSDCIRATTPEDYCLALQKDHYATAHNYAESLINLIHSMNLKQYDVAVET